MGDLETLALLEGLLNRLGVREFVRTFGGGASSPLQIFDPKRKETKRARYLRGMVSFVKSLISGPSHRYLVVAVGLEINPDMDGWTGDDAFQDC